MLMRYALSGLLAALIAVPMYYMFYSMFNKGLDTNSLVVALILGVIAFIGTTVIANFIGQSKQKV